MKDSLRDVLFRLEVYMENLQIAILSFLGCRFSFQPPRVFKNSLDIIARMSLGLTMYTIGRFSKQSLAIMILQHLYGWLQLYIIDHCRDVFQYLFLFLNNQGITQICSYDHSY